MSMSFKNSPFIIQAPIGGTKHALYSSQATLDEKIDFQRVDILGAPNAGIVASSPIQGTFSSDFYLTAADYAKCISLTGLVPFEGGVSDAWFTSGYMNEFSISVEPLSPIKGSIKGAFYGGGIGTESNSDYSFPSEIAHGAYSDISMGDEGETLEINPNLFSMNLTWTQSFTPNYAIGGNIVNYKDGGGEIRCSLNGAGLQNAVDACSGYDVTLSLKGVCSDGSELASVEVHGLRVTSSSVTISETDGVVGTMELIGYF